MYSFLVQTFEYLLANLLDRMDQMFDKIGIAYYNEFMKQDQAVMDMY